MTNEHDETAEGETVAGDEAAPADPVPVELQLQQLNERLLRSLADAENARKRSERSRSEGRDAGIAEVVGSIAPALDSLDLAIDAAQRGGQAPEARVAALSDGLLATRRAFLNGLAKVGVEVIRTEKGDAFDPAVHEAVSEIADADVEGGRVTGTLQTGFRVGPRLIRPARVVVAATR